MKVSSELLSVTRLLLGDKLLQVLAAILENLSPSPSFLDVPGERRFTGRASWQSCHFVFDLHSWRRIGE